MARRKNDSCKNSLYEAFQSFLALIIRFELLLSPVGLVFRNVDWASNEIRACFDIIAYCGVLFLIDVLIRSWAIYRELKASENWREKALTFTFMTKASLPISDLIVTVTRFTFLRNPEGLKFRLVYFIALLRVIRWLLCPNPVRFWVGLSKLDSR